VIRLFPNRGGWLEVVCGPMFSGKSEELIRRLRRAEIAGQRVLIVKPRIDNRYDIAHVVSHAGARMRAVAVDDPADIPGLVTVTTSSASTRCQFFRRRSRSSSTGSSRRDADRRLRASTRTSAGSRSAMPRLLCRAELVDKLQAVCHRCGGPATMTQRLVDGARSRRRATRSSSGRSSSTRRAAAVPRARGARIRGGLGESDSQNPLRATLLIAGR
jgi:thymidine kinase